MSRASRLPRHPHTGTPCLWPTELCTQPHHHPKHALPVPAVEAGQTDAPKRVGRRRPLHDRRFRYLTTMPSAVTR